jgi:hypothetical protein
MMGRSSPGSDAGYGSYQSGKRMEKLRFVFAAGVKNLNGTVTSKSFNVKMEDVTCNGTCHKLFIVDVEVVYR